MSVNKYKPHVSVFIEDKANSDIANGFFVNDFIDINSVELRNYGKGWKKVADQFIDNCDKTMANYPNKVVILLIDFDEKAGYLNHYDYVKTKMSGKQISEDAQKRVFIFGVLSEPEMLKKN